MNSITVKLSWDKADNCMLRVRAEIKKLLKTIFDGSDFKVEEVLPEKVKCILCLKMVDKDDCDSAYQKAWVCNRCSRSMTHYGTD